MSLNTQDIFRLKKFIINNYMKYYFQSLAEERLQWKKRNHYYYELLEKYFRFFIPEGKKVIELGCGTGELLSSVKPSYGLGVDFSHNMVEIATKQFGSINFIVEDVEQLSVSDEFEYVIISDLLSSLNDLQKALHNLRKVSNSRTRIVISNYNYLWEPVLKLGEKIGLKHKQPPMNWLSSEDIKNLLYLEGFEIIKEEKKILLPIYIPLISSFINTFIAPLPIINRITLVNFLIVRKSSPKCDEHSVSIIVPAQNERRNIESAITRTPEFGTFQEFIFVEGHSKDGTLEEMLRVQKKYIKKNIIVMKQSGKGKGNAVREAFDRASGEVLMILDADLTMPPEDLPKYYEALMLNKGEFINGCRLVYSMEKQAMRFLNLLANKFFGALFSYLLRQHLKDTLCGTKVLFKRDYEEIKKNRGYFGDFDPFGDFDLLFGASKQNLKIVEVPIRYKERQYGESQIRRFAHGWLLIKMSLFAARKIKFT